VAFLMDDVNWYAVPCKVGPFAIPQMEFLQTVSFDLPPQITGEVSLVLWADGQWSNEVRLKVQPP